MPVTRLRFSPMAVARAGASATTSIDGRGARGGRARRCAGPLKFEMFATPGGPELTSVGDVSGFSLVSLPCTPGMEDPVDVTLSIPGSTTLGYDGSQFHLNWQTPKGAGKCYRMTMTARDGSQLTAFFKTK